MAAGGSARSVLGSSLASPSQRGFTLVEVLVASLVVAIGLVAIHHSLSGAWLMYRKGSESSDRTLSLWNKSVGFRLAPSQLGADWTPAPGLRPLRRFRVEVDSGESVLGWEVIHGR